MRHRFRREVRTRQGEAYGSAKPSGVCIAERSALYPVVLQMDYYSFGTEGTVRKISYRTKIDMCY